MPGKNWTLLEPSAGATTGDLSLSATDLGLAKCSLKKTTLRGGLSEGVETIRVDNGALSFVVLPTRGMSLWKAWRGELEIGWKSPVRGPVNPAFVPVMEPGGLGWLDGFDEWFVRCGLESNGAPDFDEKTGRLTHPLHGRIGNKPAQKVTVAVDDAGEIAITGVVDETRFHFAKLRLVTTIRTRPGETGLRIRDEIHNLAGGEGTAQLLYHINFGEPLLDAGSRIVAPVKTLVPRTEHAAAGLANWDNYQAPQAGFGEQVYFFELAGDAQGKTQVLLQNAHGTSGASVLYDTRQLPCFTLWKNTAASADGYVTGIEPGTNYPNPRSHETKQGRVIKLKSGEKAALDVELQIHASSAEVAAAAKKVASLSAGLSPKIYDKPQSGWCAP